MSMKTKASKKKVAAANPIARWGRYCDWKITVDRLNSIGDLSWSDEWDSKKKRREAATFTLDFPLRKELWQKVSIEEQMSKWRARIGKTGAFYVGSRSLAGNRQYRLTGVKFDDVRQNRGVVVACDVQLSFTETKSKKVKKTKLKRRKTTKKKPAKAKKKAKVSGSVGKAR